MRGRISFLTLLVLIFLSTTVIGAQDFDESDPERLFADVVSTPLPTNQIIIKFTSKSEENNLIVAGMVEPSLDALSQAAGTSLSYARSMSGDAHVLRLEESLPLKEVALYSARLSQLPGVAYAEPDAIKQIIGRPSFLPTTPSLIPNDPGFTDQWHYGYVPGTSEGINLPLAWNISTGSASTVIAVLDTGILNHPDLAGRSVPGYDMITDVDTANDTDGRDSDPSDPGDWVAKDECGSNPASHSSWHGTHVAGTIGAATNNGTGVAGVNWNGMLQAVRVLGKCGGSTSDIVDAIRWAAGISVAGVPDNANPAKVINMSLGGPGPCAISEQSAIDDAVAAGTTIVISAGNNDDESSGYSPGNCSNIITVAATDRSGNRAYYSNYGSSIEVSAPGGETNVNFSDGILSTLNTGLTVPSTHTYAYYQGTSMAAPHVAGLASLVVGLNPVLTPAQVLGLLEDNARPFPVGSNCSTSNCGAGIIDAFTTLWAVEPPIFGNAVYLPVVSDQGAGVSAYFNSPLYVVGEGDGTVSLPVRLSRASLETIRVDYATGNGSAVTPGDYTGVSSQLVYDPGEVEKEIQININDDLDSEVTETFHVQLQGASGALIGQPSLALVTIMDNDESPPIANGDFEDGQSDWIEQTNYTWDLIVHSSELPAGVFPRSGDYAVWLGGGHDEIGYIEQNVTVSAAKPYLVYWHWIASEDICFADIGGVIMGGDVADYYDLCISSSTGGWVKHSVDLSTWIGQSIDMQLRIETDSSLYSSLFIDDVSFAAAP